MNCQSQILSSSTFEEFLLKFLHFQEAPEAPEAPPAAVNSDLVDAERVGFVQFFMHPKICIHIRIDLNTAPLNCHDLRKLIFEKSLHRREG